MNTPVPLPSGSRMAQVHLRTRSLQKSLSFYSGVLGFTVRERTGATAKLSAAESAPAFLLLTEDPKAPAPPARATGLFHLAIRYPSRQDLAQALRRLAENHCPLEGASDHLVSEALYLSDPEGNGVELYADRPASQWAWRDGQVLMRTDPLDLNELLGTLKGQSEISPPQPQTTLGHIHLHVADLAEAERFYHQFLGLAVTQRSYPGALFFAADAYHHHIATNTWAGKVPPPENSVGLISYRLEVPNPETLLSLGERAARAGYETRAASRPGQALLQIRDPNRNWLELSAS